jgi:DNA-binding LacI/PurR family transcriptional regulator
MFPVRLWQKGPTDYSAGREAALSMLDDGVIDGAFCVTDLLALGFLDAARLDRGRSVPRDLSVIGFDDIPPGRMACLSAHHRSGNRYAC